VILRCGHVYGVGGLWFTAVVQGALADPPLAIGDEPTAPVWADDVAGVLAAAEDRSAGPAGLAGTWAIEGPEALRPAEITRALRGDETDVLPIDARVANTALSALLGIPLAPFAVAHLLRSSRADAPDAAGAFGVPPTTLSEGLRRTVQRIPGAAQVASEDG
jgi:uncharacterized protein YbjT (DUF2867 family)